MCCGRGGSSKVAHTLLLPEERRIRKDLKPETLRKRRHGGRGSPQKRRLAAGNLRHSQAMLSIPSHLLC